jgi:hypothetical protein
MSVAVMNMQHELCTGCNFRGCFLKNTLPTIYMVTCFLVIILTFVLCLEGEKREHLTLYVCNETNLMHYLSSVYSVTIPSHVSGLLLAHNLEVTMYICNKRYGLYVSVDCQLVCLSGTPQPCQLTVN